MIGQLSWAYRIPAPWVLGVPTVSTKHVSNPDSMIINFKPPFIYDYVSWCVVGSRGFKIKCVFGSRWWNGMHDDNMVCVWFKVVEWHARR